VPRIGAYPSPGTSPAADTGDTAGQRTEGAGQTVPCQRDPAPLWETFGELLALSDERDSWMRLLLSAGRDSYQRGLADGIALGRRLEGVERDAAWNAIARPVARGGPSYDELERKRWAVHGEPRTRETFGLPHPDDYKGRERAS
jgi:hypothetical protein